jgi:hypothetical protein
MISFVHHLSIIWLSLRGNEDAATEEGLYGSAGIAAYARLGAAFESWYRLKLTREINCLNEIAVLAGFPEPALSPSRITLKASYDFQEVRDCIETLTQPMLSNLSIRPPCAS